MEILLPTQILKINFYYLKAKKHSNGLILQEKLKEVFVTNVEQVYFLNLKNSFNNEGLENAFQDELRNFLKDILKTKAQKFNKEGKDFNIAKKFHVKGVFCSFSCMLAYKNDNSIYQSKRNLINFL